MRIIWLTALVLGGIMVGSLRGQEQSCTALLLEQIKQQHHVKLTFYRLHMDSAKGDWHLFNEEDVRMLREIQDKIDNGQYSKTKIEWQSRLVDEGLPE